MEFYVSVFIFALISVVAVAGVYVLTGLTGMFSLGQASFMAIGAYLSGVLVVKYALPFPVAAVAAVAVSVLIGFVVGLPTVRLRRDYISLVTLGFGEAITALLNQSVQFTGGAMGFSGIPMETSFGLVSVSALGSIAVVGFFKSSKYGRQCIALKSDELAAKAMGINVPRIKMIAFLIAVALTSYSGVLYAFYTTYVDPSMFGWKKSSEWVIMVFFGGVNSLTGSIAATLILTALPETLRFASEYRMLFYTVLVLLIINFKPSGLFGEFELTPKSFSKLFSRRKKAEARNALQTNSIHKSFGGVQAVVDFSMSAEKGEIVGVIGPNGAGKTSIFNVVSGVYPADSGTIVLDGEDITRVEQHRITRKGISRTFQNIRLFKGLSVVDNVMCAFDPVSRYSVFGSLVPTPRRLAEEKRGREICDHYLDIVGLSAYRNEKPENLAYGLRRRLEIARAMTCAPKVLLLDEPAAGLNPKEVSELTELILRLGKDFGLAILLIEHRLELVMGISHRIYVQNFGRTIAVGTPAEVRAHPEVIKAYLGEESCE